VAVGFEFARRRGVVWLVCREGESRREESERSSEVVVGCRERAASAADGVAVSLSARVLVVSSVFVASVVSSRAVSASSCSAGSS